MMYAQGKIAAYLIREMDYKKEGLPKYGFYGEGELGEIALTEENAVAIASEKAKVTARSGLGRRTMTYVIPLLESYDSNEFYSYRPEKGNLIFGEPIAMIDSDTLKDVGEKFVIILYGESRGYHDAKATGWGRYAEAKYEYPAGFYTGKTTIGKKGFPIPSTTRELSEAKTYESLDSASSEKKFGWEDDVWGDLVGAEFTVQTKNDESKDWLDRRFPLPRKGFTQKTRLIVYQKYDGHCAYCGRKIPLTSMQVDHLASYMENKGTNDLSNLMPACPDCNRVKGSSTLEGFRKLLIDEPRVLETSQNYDAYKMSKAYGLIKRVYKTVVFYFETHGENKQGD
jgi:hypothetical protein